MNSLRITAKLRFGLLSPSGRTLTYSSALECRSSPSSQILDIKKPLLNLAEVIKSGTSGRTLTYSSALECRSSPSSQILDIKKPLLNLAEVIKSGTSGRTRTGTPFGRGF
jgi:hypothetical protein